MAADDTGATIARAFVEARREGRAIETYPGERPADLAEAYAIQDAALALWERSVGGWKVGRINAPDDARLGADRLAGPIFTDAILTGDEIPEMPVFADGFAAGEAEFMIRLAVPDPDASLPEDDEATLGWIDEVRIGIEVASSPYPGINADGPCVTVSDHGNNAGLVLGMAIERDRWLALRQIGVETRINGETIARATADTMLDGPLGAVRFLLTNLRGRGIPLRSGTWVSSGAVTGVHPTKPGDRVTGIFDGVGEVACRIVAR